MLGERTLNREAIVVPPPKLTLEIFTAGKRPSMDGREFEINEAHLDEVVKTYDPKVFRAPLIVNRELSHSTDPWDDQVVADAPICHGIPSTLKRVGKKLVAVFDKHTPELKQWLEQGRIPGLSASFYLPDSPSNPYPGHWALRHVAAVMRPAVKGMNLPGFSEGANFGTIAEFGLADDTGFIEFGCSGGCGGGCTSGSKPCAMCSAKKTLYGGGAMMMYPESPTLEAVLRPLRDYFIEQGGVELANRILPEYGFRAIDEKHQQKFHMMHEAIESLSEALEAKHAEISDLRMQISMLRQDIAMLDRRCDSTNSRVDGLISEVEGDMEEEELTTSYPQPYGYSPGYSPTYAEPLDPDDLWTSQKVWGDRATRAIDFLRGQQNG